jgi:NitT/TauT family transport system substrate-binding protein
MRRFQQKLVLLLATLTLVVGATAATAADEKLLSVDVGLGDVSLTKLIFILADEHEIYRANGLAVRQFITPRAAETISKSGVTVPAEFVREGEGSINIGGGSPMIVARSKGDMANDRVIIATQDETSRFQVVARQGINTAEDLKGKKIGYSSAGALSHYSAIMFVNQMGWDPNMDVTLVPNSMSVEALNTARVDAFLANEVPRSQALSAGYKAIADLDSMKIPMAGSGVNAERAWLKDNRETARRFVKSTIDAIALAKNDKPAVFAALAKWYRITDAQEQEHIYEEVRKFTPKPYPAVEGIKATIKVFDSPGMQKLKLDELYDSSFVTEFDKSGYIDSLYEKK